MARLVKLEGQKTQRTYYAESYDQFCNLPESIIHHIFSLLSMKDIARIGTVSKKCREIFIFSPYLKFASTCSYDSSLCKQFSDYVDRVLSLRNSSDIRSLALRWVCDNNECDVDVHLADKWIDIAVRCGVQELEIEVGVREDAMFEFPKFKDAVFKLPKCIFISRKLRVLKLDMRYNRLQEPTGALPSLEDLCLRSLQVSDSCLEEWVSTACPSLKRLMMSNVRGVIENLNIVSKSLEELDLSAFSCNLLKNVNISTERLRKLCLDLKTVSKGHLQSMKITAPNLQELTWIGGMASNIELSEFKFLKNATLSVGIRNDYAEGLTIGNRLAELFLSVRFVRVLQINSEVLEMLFMRNRLSVVLDSLRHLTVTVECLVHYHFSVFTSLLMGLRNLRTLSLKCHRENRYPPYHSSWLTWMAIKFYAQHNNGFRNLIGDQLSTIEIELKGNGHEVVFFVESIIEAAKGLQKITIFYSRENSEMLSKMRKEISTTASRSLEVNLVEKEFGECEDPY